MYKIQGCLVKSRKEKKVENSGQSFLNPKGDSVPEHTYDYLNPFYRSRKRKKILWDVDSYMISQSSHVPSWRHKPLIFLFPSCPPFHCILVFPLPELVHHQLWQLSPCRRLGTGHNVGGNKTKPKTPTILYPASMTRLIIKRGLTFLTTSFKCCVINFSTLSACVSVEFTISW